MKQAMMAAVLAVVAVCGIGWPIVVWSKPEPWQVLIIFADMAAWIVGGLVYLVQKAP